MDNKSIWIAALATTTAAAAGFGAVMYNKWKTAEGLLEVANNRIEGLEIRCCIYEGNIEAMDDHIKKLQNHIKDEEVFVKNNMAKETLEDTLDPEELKTSTVFEYYDRNIKGTDIGEKIETKYDKDKAAIEEDMKNDAEEFVNEYQQRLKEIAEETGVEIEVERHVTYDGYDQAKEFEKEYEQKLEETAKEAEVERHISYGGHDLAAEEDTSQWAMPGLDEVDNTPAWYVEPHKPDKNGRVAPYEINNLTFTQDKDYKKEAVFYYPMMERLEDEGGAKVDIDKSISWMALTWFGSDPEDPNRIYVRNQEKKTDYEVIQVV